MRNFVEIQRELRLVPLREDARGHVSTSPGDTRGELLVVRLLDGEVPPALIPAWVDLTVAAAAWIAADAELARVARVEQPVEVGTDFVASRRVLGTSLRRFVEHKPWPPPEWDAEDVAAFADEGPPPAPEVPDELAVMQRAYRERAATTATPRERLLVEVLARAILAPAITTVYDHGVRQFVIAELEPSRAELERWATLAPS